YSRYSVSPGHPSALQTLPSLPAARLSHRFERSMELRLESIAEHWIRAIPHQSLPAVSRSFHIPRNTLLPRPNSEATAAPRDAVVASAPAFTRNRGETNRERRC